MPAIRLLRRAAADRIFLLRHHAARTTRAGIAKRSATAQALPAECVAARRATASMRPQKPLISVLIDTYNYGRYVEEAIESVLAQDFPADEREILVVDDGSTDDTPARVRKFGGAVTYLRKSNGGQASAFNFGLSHAGGKYVALLDADDYWLPGKLSRVAEEFEKHRD